jgi:hypothetical protein
MRCKRSLLGVVIVSICVAASGQDRPPARAASAQPVFVSMVSLLASPQKYDGKFIRVMGFLGLEPESRALYLHEEDYEYGLTKNSFAVKLKEKQEEKARAFHKKYVIVEGIFSANGPDAREMTSGAIFNISRLEGWGDSRWHK